MNRSKRNPSQFLSLGNRHVAYARWTCLETAMVLFNQIQPWRNAHLSYAHLLEPPLRDPLVSRCKTKI